MTAEVHNKQTNYGRKMNNTSNIGKPMAENLQAKIRPLAARKFPGTK